MTVKEAVKLRTSQLEELAETNPKELRHIVQVLASAGNKRLKRLQAAGFEKAPAPRYILEESGGKFSTKGKDSDLLIQEFQRAKQFLSPSTKTSTVSGAREVLSDISSKTSSFMSEEVGFDDYSEMSTEEQNEFWKFFSGRSVNNVLDAYFGGYRGKESIKLAAQVYQRSKTKSIHNLRNAFRKAAQRQYVKQQTAYQSDLSAYQDQQYTSIYGDDTDDSEDEY